VSAVAALAAAVGSVGPGLIQAALTWTARLLGDVTSVARYTGDTTSQPRHTSDVTQQTRHTADITYRSNDG
jgi:hypothetical protein